MNPINYPLLPPQVDPKQLPVIAGNWTYSAETLRRVNKALTKCIDRKHVAIAVAGSLGRLDASEQLSDFDYLLLVDDKNLNVAEIESLVREVAGKEKLPLPNPEGAFAQPILVEDLISKTGSAEDDLYISAKRLLLLMESKPLFNELEFKNILNRILDKYLRRVDEDRSKEPLFLLNDIIRYFRGICVNYEFSFWKQNQRWGLRYIKLLHSRILMYSGLLFLVLNSSKTSHAQHKKSYISNHVELTPLEKILHVYEDNGDYSYNYLLGIYNVFLMKMNDAQLRAQLDVDFENRHAAAVYQELRVTGDALRKELMRFLWSRRGCWSDNALEYLIF
jgi:hypothetical protein